MVRELQEQVETLSSQLEAAKAKENKKRVDEKDDDIKKPSL